MWFLIIGLAWLLVALLAVVVARPREGWRAATQAPAKGRISLSPAEERMAWLLAVDAYALDCPEGIAHFEESVVAMLQQRKAAGS